MEEEISQRQSKYAVANCDQTAADNRVVTTDSL